MDDRKFVWNADAEEKLRAGLEQLNGYDYERAEREEAKAGNTPLNLMGSKAFQARLGSYALNVPVPVIRKLPLREYNELTSVVLLFLLVGSGGSEQVDSTDERQSDAQSTAGSVTGSSAR